MMIISKVVILVILKFSSDFVHHCRYVFAFFGSLFLSFLLFLSFFSPGFEAVVLLVEEDEEEDEVVIMAAARVDLESIQVVRAKILAL